ncbi:MAG: ATP-binding protein, partial [Trichodesmium sp. St2_bin2_1]|nr:ATP-binding protein [Trichodesmium sp. St2_bin2_1]
MRWYVEKYGGGEGLAKQETWERMLEFLRQHPNQWRLLFQGLILMVCVPFLFRILLQQIGFTIDWLGVALGVALGAAFGVARGMAVGVVVSVALGVALGVAGGVAFGVVLVVAIGVAYGVARGVRLGVWLGAALGVAFGVAFGVALHAVIGVPVGLDLKLGVVLGLAGGLAGGVARWRPENWLIGVPLNSISIQNRSFLLPRVTPIPLPLLKNRLKLWLRKDWQLGIENIDQLFKYSLQFIPVVNAINDVLAEIPSEQIIYRISQLAENPYDWKLVKFSSASLEEERIRLDTPSRTTAAGFWYLHEKEPKKATVAFEQVRDILYGEEMFLLAQTITQFQTATSPDTIAEIKIPNFPPEPHLRPITWKVLKGLRRVVEDTKLILTATSKSARSFALNRAIGQLAEI